MRFNNNDFIILQEAVEILEPFAEITCRIQSESVVTASLVVPSVVHFFDHLKNIKPHVLFLKKMCIQLEQAITKRFSGIVKRLSQQFVSINDPFSDPIYFICAVLDPEFRFLWLSQMNYNPTLEAQMKQSLIQMILDECEESTDSSSENIKHTQSLSSSKSFPNSYTTQSINENVSTRYVTS